MTRSLMTRWGPGFGRTFASFLLRRRGWFFLVASVGLASAAEENRDWDPRFYLPGVQGEVSAIAVSGTNLYVGGQFIAVDDLAATNIARWNGAAWSSLGSGLDGGVRALAVSGSKVYAGGTFSLAGNVAVNRIAQWNGTEWKALGSGISDGSVDTLALSPDGKLYMGGSFDFIGSVGATNLACWDGVAWMQVGGGVDSTLYPPRVRALLFLGGDLYVGGLFTEAGGVRANHIAKWNGSDWTSLGGGVDDRDYPAQVSALASLGGNLYAGGSFSSAGSEHVKNVALWNGSSWSALGEGMERFFGDLPITALVARGPEVIAGGRFNVAGGVSATNLAAWNGSSWAPLGGGAAGQVNALAADGTSVLVGGEFKVGVQTVSQALMEWNDTQWSAVSVGGGLGIQGPSTCLLTGCRGDEVSAIVVRETNVYVAGGFTSGGLATFHNVARWDGATWWPLGDGLQGRVYSLAVSSNCLFAGGNFTFDGGGSSSNLACWDGAAWTSVGAGLNGTAHALAVRGNELYVGGTFTMAGAVSASNVARWDGSAWSALGNGINGPVYALAVRGTEFYAGGEFTMAGSVTASNLARWDGGRWSEVGGGVGGVFNTIARIRPPPVSALAVRGHDLYVAGDFIWAGGVSAINVAKWDGTNWTVLGAGVVGPLSLYPQPTVRALLPCGNALYAAGTFLSAGGIPSRNIAQWDGAHWSSLGDGMRLGGNSLSSVEALAGSEDQVFVGGHFRFAGGHPAVNFSILHSAPRLHITRRNETLEINWPETVSPYRLQAAEALDEPEWHPITNAPVHSQREASVILSPSLRSQFFRLIKE